MDKIETTKGSGGGPLTKEGVGGAAQVGRGLTVLPAMGLEVADTVVDTVVSVLDVVRTEATRSTMAAIDLAEAFTGATAKFAETVAGATTKTARQATDLVNRTTATILQTVGKFAHEGIANTRATMNAVADSATQVITGQRPPAASA